MTGSMAASSSSSLAMTTCRKRHSATCPTAFPSAPQGLDAPPLLRLLSCLQLRLLFSTLLLRYYCRRYYEKTAITIIFSMLFAIASAIFVAFTISDACGRCSSCHAFMALFIVTDRY